MHIVDLLRARPEQEVNLLRLAVNKLGDLDRKVASRASHLLLGLQEAHPAMKGIIVNAISEVVFRNNADYHTRYYSMITLNQVILAHKDGVVANSLIKIYLSLFERLLAEWDKEKDQVVMETKHKSRKKKAKGKHGGARQESKTAQDIKEEQAAKLTASILTGLNRAYPFSDLPKDVFDKHVNTLYRVTHSANFNTAVQALILIYQISKDQSLLSDRFYRTLYESLLDSRLANSSKLRLYLNLVFKSLREDVNVDRVRAFAKRMVQVADHWLNIGVVSAVVFLISEIGKQMPKILSLLKDSGSQDGVEYDGRHRDPQYAKANESVRLWELLPLVNHFHPTAALYAEGLLTGDSSALIKPDITLHTLTHFLDRFVYRNPRQTTKTKGGSIMQPLAGYDPTSIVDTKTLAQVPANSADWASMKPDRVAPDERFFYHYFVNKQAPKEKAKKAKGGRPDEDGEFNEDDIWNALVNSRPDVEGEDSDVDSLSMTDMSDFDEENGADIDDDELVAEDDEKVVVESGDEESDVAEESSDQGDVLEMDDLEDEDGMLSSDEELPSDELESDSAMEENQKSSGKRSKSDKRPSKRLKLKDLPVFGDMNDYAKYLDSEDEDYS
jgi:ribosome biogenesis protein MAK21